MPLKAVSNTSPLLYLYRIGGLEWLSALFDSVWLPASVAEEFKRAAVRDMMFRILKITNG
jgi:predicted nucleic acid-binding protein